MILESQKNNDNGLNNKQETYYIHRLKKIILDWQFIVRNNSKPY